MRKNLKNAIKIKCCAFLLSPSVELLILFSFLISLVYNLWPEIANKLFHKTVVIADNTFLIGLSIMILCTIFVLMMTLFITRIGIQVGFEKGNRLTEIILTSITRKELYVAHFCAGAFIMLLAFVIICIPMILAQCFHWEMAAVFHNINFKYLLFIMIHIATVLVFYIGIAIALTSRIKKIEDTGLYLAMLMIPNVFSQIYYCIVGGLYQGKLFILNYIPFVSLLTGLGAALQGEVKPIESITMLIADFAWCVIACIFCCKVYEKNIEIR